MREQYSVPISRLQRVELLAVGAGSKDCQSLQSILSHTNWLVHWVADQHEALLFLEEYPVPVLLCPALLPDAAWSDLLHAIQVHPAPPKVLVYSSSTDSTLGCKVLEAGGYDLLATPFDRDQVLRTISLACRTWREEIRRQSAQAAAMTA